MRRVAVVWGASSAIFGNPPGISLPNTVTADDTAIAVNNVILIRSIVQLGIGGSDLNRQRVKTGACILVKELFQTKNEERKV